MDPASTSFVLGYHGCDRRLAERVFAGKDSLHPSHNDYDWLGDGIYFWEHNAQRAFEFARKVSRRPHPSGQKIRTPAVVGAIIDLGFCLNLLDSRSIEMVRKAYDDFVQASEAGGMDLPKNTGGRDHLKRQLDCAVLRMLHQTRKENRERPFDTVRAAFSKASASTPTPASPPGATSRSASANSAASRATSGRWTRTGSPSPSRDTASNQ